MALALVIILLAVLFGVIGLAKGLLWLLIIAAALFLVGALSGYHRRL